MLSRRGLQDSRIGASVAESRLSSGPDQVFIILTKKRHFGYHDDHMNPPDLNAVLERQLLLQLGDRLRRLRKAKGLGTVEMAARVGVTRNTLRAVECGDPSPSIGTYLRVMSTLGISGELALIAGDTLQSPPPESAAARSSRSRPVVQVLVSADDSRHRAQDLLSLALHEEAVRLARANPALVQQAQETVQRWLQTGDPRSGGLWQEWEEILRKGAWRKVLGRSRRAQELRQASPLVTVVPEDIRQGLLNQIQALKKGVALGATPGPGEP
jgi:transcriptional regulator with XRE-family HTH domain